MRKLVGRTPGFSNRLGLWRSYFFFSFEHKHVVVQRTAAAGRWFLMIGFGAIFGATVMGRMTLFIGRLNFILTDWWPEATKAWTYVPFRISVVVVALGLVALAAYSVLNRKPADVPPPDES